MRHRLHSLCPYFAMFPESFAETWIERLTKRNDVVLDPFSGRGTTAFQALLMNRRAVALDVNDVAFCLTKAKTQAPALAAVKQRISKLENRFDGRSWRHEAESCPEFFQHAFTTRTLQQLLFLRATLKWATSPVDAMVAALALGSLHGEMDKSQSYFSNQMPRTISTKPAYSIRYWHEREMYAPKRNVFELLRQRAEFRYESVPPVGESHVFHRDMRELPWIRDSLPKRIACCITSPPYLDVTSFEEDQWLRLWFLGRASNPTRGEVSRDDRHSFAGNYWQFIADMWRSLGAAMSQNSDVVIRIGTHRIPPDQLIKQLTASSRFTSRKVELVSSEVSAIKNRQTERFRPGSKGCLVEADCHFKML